jgi:SHS family lactate transporter-like MFS transporter
MNDQDTRASRERSFTRTAPHAAAARSNASFAVVAGFLGWTLDAFDFFVVVFVLSAVAKSFGRSIPTIALTLTITLAMRPVGAFIFGLLADHYGRRLVLLANVAFFSLMEVMSGLAQSYTQFFLLRLLYGIGMGGNWGVGASLAMESAPPKWRGILSGLLQEGYALGNVLAAITYYTVFPRWGWRAMFFVGAAPGLVTMLICLRVEDPRAWQESRTDWSSYRRAIFKNSGLFLYLVALMAAMNLISHGTQDLYPTFLQRQRHFDVNTTALITGLSMFGALLGGIVFGHFSDRRGRRHAMVCAELLGLAAVPLWIMARSQPLILLGAFVMQFMVQGAWGVIPAHINELSPPQLRGFFPGFAYQLGVLIASSIGYIEALLGEHFSYSISMGSLAVVVLCFGVAVISAGPEAKGVSFVHTV